MSRICHETGQDVYNPFYFVTAVLRDKENNRYAFSNLEVSVSAETVKRVKLNALPDSPEQMEEDIFFRIQKAGGTEGGFTGAVQLCWGYVKDESARYVSQELANSKLPKSARDLLANPDWLEVVDGDFSRAAWAKNVYAKLRR